LSTGRPSLSENLSRLVLDLIRTDGLKAGDRLPAVAALAARFGVATPTLREALRRLEATGAIEIRHGSGMYVRDGFDRALVANPHVERLDERRFLDLLEARLLIEPHLAHAAARLATPADLDGLERLLEEARRHLGGTDDRALHAANASFHTAIARLSGNEILSGVVESLLGLYSFEQLKIIELYNDRAEDHAGHLLIFKAIRDADAALARDRMHDHLRGVRDVVERRLKGGA
jgi:GntR family transcriptional repressor for pyruvate dehydrogenase complex